MAPKELRRETNHHSPFRKGIGICFFCVELERRWTTQKRYHEKFGQGMFDTQFRIDLKLGLMMRWISVRGTIWRSDDMSRWSAS
jgi:hypothetical protein